MPGNVSRTLSVVVCMNTHVTNDNVLEIDTGWIGEGVNYLPVIDGVTLGEILNMGSNEARDICEGDM